MELMAQVMLGTFLRRKSFYTLFTTFSILPLRASEFHPSTKLFIKVLFKKKRLLLTFIKQNLIKFSPSDLF